MQVVIQPPYSAYLDQLSQSAILNITNNNSNSLTLYLRAQIANGDKFIRTKMNVFSDPIQIGANRTFTLNSVNFNFASFLGSNSIEDNLTDAEINAIYRDKILPEGDYMYCIWAYTRDANGNYHPVSINGLPQGQELCTSFVIIFAQPPVITSPIDQTTLDNKTLSNITFSWMPPSRTAPGSSIRYDLYIVKVDNGQDPDAAMQNTFTYHSNYYIKIPDISLTSHVLNTLVSPYRFEPGQQYAVMIQARDVNNKTFFENEGKSQVITFRTSLSGLNAENNALTFNLTSPSKSADQITVSPQKDMYVNWSWLLNNKLFNSDTVKAFQDKHVAFYRMSIRPAAPKTGYNTDAAFNFQIMDTAKVDTSNTPFIGDHFQATADSLRKIGMKNDYWYHIYVDALDKNHQVVADAQSSDFDFTFSNYSQGPTVKVRGQLLYRFDNYAQNYPIPNTEIRVYPASEQKTLSTVNSRIIGNLKPVFQSKDLYVKTDSAGKFAVNIPVPSGMAADTSYKIEIENPYYQPIDTAVFHLSRVFSSSVTADTTKLNIGQLVTKAYSYSLTLQVKKGFSSYKRIVHSDYISGYDSNNNPIFVPTIDSVTVGAPDSAIQELPAGLTVMLYRKQKPDYLPPVEGELGRQSVDSSGIVPVAKGKTAIKINKNGKKESYVKFNRLLCNVFNNDTYYIKALQPGKSDTSDDTESFQEGSFKAPEQEFVFHRPYQSDSTHFNVDTTYQIISKDPPKSAITGQLLYRWPCKSCNTLRPLSNEKFSIVVEYLYNGKPVDSYGLHPNPLFPNGHVGILLNGSKPLNSWDAGQVMATGKTDANGRFTVQAVNLNEKGVLGSGEVDTAKAAPPPVSSLTPGMQNQQQQIIDPSDPSGFGSLGDLGGMLDGNSIFNFSNIGSGSSFGINFQQSGLNGSMNFGTGGFAAQQTQGFGASNFSGTKDPKPFAAYSSPEGYGPLADNDQYLSRKELPQGNIQRVYRIVLNDKDLYYNPDSNIVVQPLKAKGVGPITVMVKEVKWDLKVVNDKGVPLTSDIKAVVFRDPSTKFPGLPQGEGDGLYRMKKLINPKLHGEVTSPESEKQTSTTSGNQRLSEGGSGQWMANEQPISGAQFFNDTPSWPADSYEWLADSTVNSKGHVPFGKMLSGFMGYNVELSSIPQTGHNLFYQAKIQSLDAGSDMITYDNNVSPADNGSYWDERKTDIPVAHLTIQMKPFPSRIGGRVEDKSSGLGLKAEVSVELTKMINGNAVGPVTTIKTVTDSSGYFEILHVFDKANMAPDVKNIQVEMHATVYGYRQEGIKIGTVNRTGSQYIDNILMVPGNLLTGYVKNEQGKPVDAYIKRTDGKIVSTGTAPPHKVVVGSFGGPFSFVTSNAGAPGQFAIPAPSGRQDTLYIIPKDVGYFNDTLHVFVKDGLTNLNSITVFRRKHRMQFIVRDAITAAGISQARLSLSKSQDTLTNDQGKATFSFENVSVDNYTLKVEGPRGQGYVPQVINLKNNESRNLKTYIIKLKKGGTITGMVTLDGKAVKGARVYLDYQQQTSQNYWWSKLTSLSYSGSGSNQQTLSEGGLPEIAARSDAGGHYTLSGIPINSGTVNVIATLDTSFTVIGDKETVSLTSSTGSQNLQLKSFHRMLIKKLYGFPLSVENIETTSNNNQVRVTGLVDLSKGTSDFSFLTGTQHQVRISDVLFVSKTINGQAVGVPSASDVNMDAVSSLKMSYLNRYNVLLTANGAGASTPQLLQIGKNKTGTGTVNGYVNIVDNSFNYPSSYLNFTRKDQFYLGKISGSQINNKLDAILAPTNLKTSLTKGLPTPLKQPALYHLSNLKAQPIQFKFIRFDASADPLHSYLDKDGKIHLDVSMQAHIPHAQPEDFTVHAGDIILDNDKVYPATDTSTITIALGQKKLWKLEARHWSIDPRKGGIYSTDALIKTGVLDIPCKEFNLRADMFVMDKFQLNELELGGGVKMLKGIDSQNTQLVYDVKTGSDMSAHWKLVVSGKGNNPAAVIKNISENGQGHTFLSQNIPIEYIELLDNGENILTIQQTKKPILVQNNGLAQFRPQSISSGPDSFEITGGLTIPAPRLSPIMTTLQFSGKPTALKMAVKPVQMSFEGKGYVDYFSNDALQDTITHNKIIIPGYVQEKGGFNPITATFYADGSTTDHAHYHVDVEKGFILNLTSESPKGGGGGKDGDYKLKLLRGGMEVPQNANDWDLLKYTGNLQTTDKSLNTDSGDTTVNKMTFTITGDVDVSGDQASVSNLNLGFGTMSMVYEFPQKRLIGQLKVKQIKMASFSASGEIDMQIDQKGWYFLGAMSMNTGLPAPFSSMNMGFLLGNRVFSPAKFKTVTDEVGQYAYDKSSLCWLRDPKRGPGIHGVYITAGKNMLDKQIGLSLAVASLYLHAIAGGEASLYADFTPTWSITVSAGVYAQVDAAAAALIVTVNGSANVKGSVTGSVSPGEICLGGKMLAHMTVDGNVDFPAPAPDVSFGPLTENAVLQLIFSNQGTKTNFYFGSAPPPACDGSSACSN